MGAAYLEDQPQWELLHPWFIRKLAEQVMPLAREMGFYVDVERSIYQMEPSGDLVLLGAPDFLTGPEDDFFSPDPDPVASGGSAVAIAEPKAVHEIVLDPDDLNTYWQDFIVIRKKGRFDRVLAVIELLSPSNKSGSYAPRYREKRRRLLSSQAHFMEIDFLRDGKNLSRELFPEVAPTPYFVFLARKTGNGRKEECYPIRLQDRLPIMGLPLVRGRPELPLDLAAAFESAYDLSMHRGSVKYRTDPVPAPELSSEDAEWVRSIVETS